MNQEVIKFRRRRKKKKVNIEIKKRRGNKIRYRRENLEIRDDLSQFLNRSSRTFELSNF